MLFLIYILSAVLVINCLLLILLVLIQLPKKEAGAGLAFGGAATDALFGAGSGNVLTKITKWGTLAFFIVAMILASLQSSYYHKGSGFKKAFEQQSTQSPIQPLPGANPLPQTAAPETSLPETTPAAPVATPTNLSPTPNPAN